MIFCSGEKFSSFAGLMTANVSVVTDPQAIFYLTISSHDIVYYPFCARAGKTSCLNQHFCK